MIIDTHVHYNLDPLYADWQRYWKEAQAAGVSKSIVVGTDAQSNARAIEIAHQDPNLFCAVGYHPTDTPASSTHTKIQQLRTLIEHHKDSLVAIGECGLDYLHIPKDQNAEQEKHRQKLLFGEHIALAKTYDLPLIIHCRDAYDDLLDVLNHFSKSDGKTPRAVLHCMSGSIEYLNKALELGFYISFAGNVTYKNADSIRELARHTPHNRLLIETDAPFLAPQSKRGNINEPAYIAETSAFLADFLSMEKDLFEEITNENSMRFFGVQTT